MLDSSPLTSQASGWKNRPNALRSVRFGGPDRIRTDDFYHAMVALYQLSYGPVGTDANKAPSAPLERENHA
jgi:hypothetical protein